MPRKLKTAREFSTTAHDSASSGEPAVAAAAEEEEEAALLHAAAFRRLCCHVPSVCSSLGGRDARISSSSGVCESSH